MKKIDVNTCDEHTKRAAKVFYTRYCTNAEGSSHPTWGNLTWEDLVPVEQSHWCAVAILASDTSMAVIREFVTMRLDHMASRPLMFASNKESFGVQLVLLAEMIVHTVPEMASGLSHTAELTLRLWGPVPRIPQEPIDTAWAKTAIEVTKAFLEEKCPRT